MLYITASSSSKQVETAVEGPGERKLKGPAERRAGRLMRQILWHMSGGKGSFIENV